MPKRKVIIAKILQALLDGGVKLDSPYAVENWIEDNLTHDNMKQFFYKGEEEADVAQEIKEVLKPRAK